ncbi:hypothetical protein HHK36_008704 [Tetracentron sinense]|uniref:Reverse transcriptase zinc-binding domain-containing protein n=1 Tax=Tetracentron sinense TaxID=13715 RepID=A0A834ZFY8_TETSI|nr:hypothetical protein HHK36_008704 [Tetracentron sinense]
MQQGDFSTPYYQYHQPHPQNPNPNPNPNPHPSDLQPNPLPPTYASAPPFSSNYPSSDYPGYSSTYPQYPQNPDHVPPTGPSYAPNPNFHSFNPPSQSPSFPSTPEPQAPYPPPIQQPSYYPQYDQHQTAPNYAPPPSIPPNPSPNSNPNSSLSSLYSTSYNHPGSSVPPVFENLYESSVKFDHGGGYFDENPSRYGGQGIYSRSRSDLGREFPEKKPDSGLRYELGGLRNDGIGDGIYAYDGGKVEPYGARGTGSKSSTWSAFDDYGRSTSLSSGKDQLSSSKIVRAIPKVETQQDVKSGVQKFRVKLLSEGGGQSNMDVLCQVRKSKPMSRLSPSAMVSVLICNSTWSPPIARYLDLMEIWHDLPSLLPDSATVANEIIWLPSPSGTFSLKSAWQALRSPKSSIPWAEIVWFTMNIPRHSFITWLALLDGLQTRECKTCWFGTESSLELVVSFVEALLKVYHILNDLTLWPFGRNRFSCVDLRIIQFLAGLWAREVSWIFSSFWGKGTIQSMKKVAFNATIYHIWMERNFRIFKHQSRDSTTLIGLDGIRMLDPSSSRTLRIYPLETVTRWEVMDSSTFTFWAKSTVDIDPRRIRLQSNSYTTNTILDTVTAATVQLKEMGGRSKPSDSVNLSEQTNEKKKGFVDWVNLIKPGNEEKDHWSSDGDLTIWSVRSGIDAEAAVIPYWIGFWLKEKKPETLSMSSDTIIKGCRSFLMKQLPSVQVVEQILELLCGRTFVSLLMGELGVSVHFSITAGIVEIFSVTSVPMVELLSPQMSKLNQSEFVTDA